MKGSRLSPIILNDVEDKLVKVLTGNQIITLTNDFAKNIGEKVTYKEVENKSKKTILSKNIQDLSEDAKIKFFEEIKNISNVKKNHELVQQIDTLLLKVKNEKISGSHNRLINYLREYDACILKNYMKAVIFYNKHDYRNSLDSIRLVLELLLKSILNNDKSLENQKSELGNYLENKGINRQFRNLFFKVLNLYEKIQNDKVKHGVPDNLSEVEIKFLMNQAAIIIDFICMCEKQEGKVND